jgi:anti-sigma B factor antagonist
MRHLLDKSDLTQAVVAVSYPQVELEIKNQSDRITHLALRGRLDTAGVDEVELRFTSHTVPRAKPLLLDMSEVTLLASLGLRMLLRVAKALDHRGAKMVLLSPQPAVAEVLKVSGFDQLIPVHNDEVTALAFLAGGEGR